MAGPLTLACAASPWENTGKGGGSDQFGGLYAGWRRVAAADGRVGGRDGGGGRELR